MKTLREVLIPEFFSDEAAYMKYCEALHEAGYAHVPEKQIQELLERDRVLSALEAGGVSNWEWFETSLEDAGLL